MTHRTGSLQPRDVAPLVAAGLALGLTHRATLTPDDWSLARCDLDARRVDYVAVLVHDLDCVPIAVEVFASAKLARIHRSTQVPSAKAAQQLRTWIAYRFPDEVQASAAVDREARKALAG